MFVLGIILSETRSNNCLLSIEMKLERCLKWKLSHEQLAQRLPKKRNKIYCSGWKFIDFWLFGLLLLLINVISLVKEILIELAHRRWAHGRLFGSDNCLSFIVITSMTDTVCLSIRKKDLEGIKLPDRLLQHEHHYTCTIMAFTAHE